MCLLFFSLQLEDQQRRLTDTSMLATVPTNATLGCQRPCTVWAIEASKVALLWVCQVADYGPFVSLSLGVCDDGDVHRVTRVSIYTHRDLPHPSHPPGIIA